MTQNTDASSLADRVTRLERELGSEDSWLGPYLNDKRKRLEMMMPPISVRATLAQIFTRLGSAPAGYRAAETGDVFGALHVLFEENALLQAHLDGTRGQLAEALDRIESLETALGTLRTLLESSRPTHENSS